MAAIELKTFLDIYTSIQEELKLNASDTVTAGRIKRDINTIYREVASKYPFDWCRGFAQIQLQPFITATATVTQGTDVVTLAAVPTNFSGTPISVREYNFIIDGQQDVYVIREHTAGSTTMRLYAPWGQPSLTPGTGKIWQNRMALPPDCLETIQITSPYLETPMVGVGLMQIRRYISANPSLWGRPAFFGEQGPTDSSQYGAIGSLPATVSRASNRYVKTIVFASDVSSYLAVGNRIRITAAGQFSYNVDSIVASVSTTTITYVSEINYNEATAADTNLTVTLLSQRPAEQEFREVIIHPSIGQEMITLSVDYKRRVIPLDADSDEPWMPLEDRVILKYGALARGAWPRERNPTEASRNESLYMSKLMEMKGRLRNSTDLPRFVVSPTYLEAKRRTQSRYRWRRF